MPYQGINNTSDVAALQLALWLPQFLDNNSFDK